MDFLVFVCVYAIIFLIDVMHCESPSVIEMDLLLPYVDGHGPAHHQHRHIRALHESMQLGDIPHELYPSHHSTHPNKETTLNSKAFVVTVGSYWEERHLTGHFHQVSNPAATVSILEPGEPGGCEKKHRRPVIETAKHGHCILATNAGFFNTTDDSCLGDIVSDGHRVLHSGKQNVHFGIRKDGSLFFGYIAEDVHIGAEFDQLVSGVIWLVRNGENFVSQSMELEASDVQETGSLEYFVDVKSARNAIGCDREGHVVMIHVDGKTGQRGISLRELADLLVEWDIVHAINLDGGGSVSVLKDSTYINYPSDSCEDPTSQPHTYQCQRPITTVVCVHEPHCDPKDCGGHGQCVKGVCECRDQWQGPACDLLGCAANNCHQHGNCTEVGCVCLAGWEGTSCEEPCPTGSFGAQCAGMCICENDARCSRVDGTCHCKPGYTGTLCQQVCRPGYYGRDCEQLCFCEHSCVCHHVTGACNVSATTMPLWEVASCLIEETIENKNLVPDQSDQLRLAVVLLITLASIAAVSLLSNLTLVCIHYRCHCHPKHREPHVTENKGYRRVYQSHAPAPLLQAYASTSEEEEEEGDFSDVDERIKLKEFKMSKEFKKESKDELNTSKKLGGV